MNNKRQNLRGQNEMRGRKAIRSLFKLGAFSAFFAILLALLYLLTSGVPTPLVRQLSRQLGKRGIPLRVQSITFAPQRGWVLHGVELYSSDPDDLHPLLQTDQLHVHIWPDAQRGWTLAVRGADIHIAPGHRWKSVWPRSKAAQTIQHLRAHVSIGKKQIQIDHSELQWNSFHLLVSGSIARGNRPPAAPNSENRLQRIHPQVLALSSALQQIRLDGPSEIHIRLNVPASGLADTTLQSNFFIPGLRWKQTRYTSLSGTVRLAQRQWTIDSLRITAPPDRALTLSGQWSEAPTRAQVHIDNTLSAQQLQTLLPAAFTNALTRADLSLSGPLDFDADIGPAAPEKLFKTLELHLHSARIARKDLTLAPLRFDLVRKGAQVNITDLKATANGGPLSGSIELDLQSGAWSSSLWGRVDPAPIATLLGGIPAHWINRFEFPTASPEMISEIRWNGTGGKLEMNTTIYARDFQFDGIAFDEFQTTLSYTNHTLALHPLQIAQKERAFSGSIALDLPEKMAHFDAETNFDPPLIAQILAPDHPTALTNLVFNGPLFCQASGAIDYSGGTRHDARGTLYAQSISAAGIPVDSFSGQIEAHGDQLLFKKSWIDLFGGSASGSARFDLQFNNQKSPYRLQGELTEIDLKALANQWSDKQFDDLTGRLAATVDLSADASVGFWESATGHSQIDIEDGQLKDLPILGGFSRLIRTTLPAFSLFSITTLYAQLDLRDGVVQTDNLELGGSLLSARVRGRYTRREGLNCMVQAEPLRQTPKEKKWYMIHLWFTNALKEGTAPLFRLLQFELSGPLDDPSWRLVNFPRELSTFLQSPMARPIHPAPSASP